MKILNVPPSYELVRISNYALQEMIEVPGKIEASYSKQVR